MSNYNRKTTDWSKLTAKALEDLYQSGALFIGKPLEELIELYIMANNFSNYTLPLSNLDELPDYKKEPLLDKERQILEAIEQLKKAIYEPLSKKDIETEEKRKHNAIGAEFLEGL